MRAPLSQRPQSPSSCRLLSQARRHRLSIDGGGLRPRACGAAGAAGSSPRMPWQRQGQSQVRAVHLRLGTSCQTAAVM
ncbi:MAG: hypothetical protein WDW36_008094 [Sanguina aurantia]